MRGFGLNENVMRLALLQRRQFSIWIRNAFMFFMIFLVVEAGVDVISEILLIHVQKKTRCWKRYLFSTTNQYKNINWDSTELIKLLDVWGCNDTKQFDNTNTLAEAKKFGIVPASAIRGPIHIMLQNVTTKQINASWKQGEQVLGVA